MKQGPIKAMHDRDAHGILCVRLTGIEFLAVSAIVIVVVVLPTGHSPSPSPSPDSVTLLLRTRLPRRRSRSRGRRAPPFLFRRGGANPIRLVPRDPSSSTRTRARARTPIRTTLQILRPQPPQFPLVLTKLGRGGSRGEAADLGDAEDGLPPVEEDGGGSVAGGGVAEAGGGEGAFRPPVVDAGEVPLDLVRGGVTVELVADVDEVLDRGDVDVVDGGEVEDDGFEGREAGCVGRGPARAGARVVPGSVLWGGMMLVVWSGWDVLGILRGGDLRLVWRRSLGLFVASL